jgi:hypothetical protein
VAENLAIIEERSLAQRVMGSRSNFTRRGREGGREGWYLYVSNHCYDTNESSDRWFQLSLPLSPSTLEPSQSRTSFSPSSPASAAVGCSASLPSCTVCRYVRMQEEFGGIGVSREASIQWFHSLRGPPYYNRQLTFS